MKNNKEIEIMDMNYLENVSECMRLISHPIRIRIIEILSKGQFSVGKIAELCGIAHNQVCEHLRLLKNRGLLDSKREGRIVYYYIVSDQLTSFLECIQDHCPN